MLIRHLPRESATARVIHGPAMTWGDTEYLLAHALDLLAAGNWQRGGGKGPRPRLCPRPGVEDREVTRYGRGGMPISEAAEYFRAWREGRLAGSVN